MGLSLQGLSGPLVGKTFPLREGMTLGRKGDLEIADPKASSIHARIEKTPEGTLAIIDNDSKNGLLINGDRLTSAILFPGTKITIGEHIFLVVGAPPLPSPPEPVAKTLSRPRVLTKATPAPEAPLAPEVPAPAPAPPPAPVSRYWYDVLAQFIEKNQDRIVNTRKALQPLAPAVILDFQRGPQLETKWTLGYGPRKIGARCLDLPIYEPGAPDVCFEVIPTPEGIAFKTAHPDKVLLNGKGVDNMLLHVGDTIRINDTVIEVDFKE